MSGVAGIPLWQGRNDFLRTWPYKQGEHTHVAFSRPVAAALVDVAEAARAIRGTNISTVLTQKMVDLDNALGALSDGWEQPTIHPPAHYQIDTSTPGWNTRYVDAVAKEHGWTRAEAQGRIADGGAR